VGFRFYRRIKLFRGVRINVSRSGISTSIGVRGAHVTVGHGKVRETVGLPGSGISYTHVEGTHQEPRSEAQAAEVAEPLPKGSAWRGWLWIGVALAVAVIAISRALGAATAEWVCFDPAYMEHFVDARSIIHIRKGVVRFWERGGAFPNGDGPDSKFPQYTLNEMNCETHMSRALRWDIALEAGMTPAALKERAKFMKSVAELQTHYPTAWESIEPSPHSYALLEFVCRSKPVSKE
jgi:hypothetical protein